MARYVDAICLPMSIEEAFDYLADFSRTAEWDPGVSDAKRITRGPVRLGSRFRVAVAFLGRRIPLEYLESQFGPGTAEAIRTLESEMSKRRLGQASDLMDVLIGYRWQEFLGPFTRDPGEITW